MSNVDTDNVSPIEAPYEVKYKVFDSSQNESNEFILKVDVLDESIPILVGDEVIEINVSQSVDILNPKEVGLSGFDSIDKNLTYTYDENNPENGGIQLINNESDAGVFIGDGNDAEGVYSLIATMSRNETTSWD